MTIPRCPPQVASRQPPVPMCMESGRLGPTVGLCGPQVGISVSLLSGMFVFACVRTCFVCVCTCSVCVLLFTRAHQGSSLEACPRSCECALLESPAGTCRGWRACLLPSLSPQGQSVYLLRASPSALSEVPRDPGPAVPFPPTAGS